MWTDGRCASRWRSRGLLRTFFWVVLCSSGFPESVDALSITTKTFAVGATVAPGCSVTSGTGGVLGTLNFGTHTGAESGQISTSFVPNASLSLACTPGVALTMSIDGGLHYSSVRYLQRNGGTQLIPYRLYSSSSLAANSELGLNQSVSVSYTDANNIALSIFAAAQLTALSTAGTYTDQLTVTLQW